MGGERPDTELKTDRKVFREFDENIHTKGIDFIKKMENAKQDKNTEKLNAYADTFIKEGKETLQKIGESIRDNFLSIDEKNLKAPKLQTYINAKKAFEEDIKTLNITNPDITNTLSAIQDFIDLKQISNINDKDRLLQLQKVAQDPIMNKQIEDALAPERTVGAMDKTIVEIQDKITKIVQKETEENTKKTDEVLNKNRTEETAKDFLEKWQNENTFNIVFDKISSIHKIDLMNYKNENNKTDEDRIKHFVEIIKTYTKNSENTKEISGISLKTADTDSKYPIWTRMIIYQDKEGKTREITFWSQDKMRQRKAEKFDIKNVDISQELPLDQFNGNGNYRALEKYIQANSQKFEENFKHIVEAVLKYEKPTTTSDNDENSDSLKNGYANVITDYIVIHPSLLPTYESYLKDTNLNILWTDKTTRIANFNKLVPLRQKNRGTMEEETKKSILEFWKKIGFQEKMTPTEIVSKGIDSLINQFGPMLFSILKMFGIGKWSLLNMFPQAKDKINEIYKKEFALSNDQITKIRSIGDFKIWENPIFSWETPTTGEWKDKKNIRLETWDDIKKQFDEKKQTKYIDTILIENNYYKDINVNVLQKWLSLYDTNKKMNINDIVTITTDKTTGKQSITEIKEGKKEIFKWIMKSILENDATRKAIADANWEIATEKEDKGKSKWANEYGEKIDTRYKIGNQKDIARYLTASLFSNKDLSYVMTENQLHNGTDATIPKEETEKDKAKNVLEKKWGVLSNILRLEINDKGMYGKFDTNKFTWEEVNTNEEALNYKNNVLTPLQDLLTGVSLGGTTPYPEFILEKIKSEQNITTEWTKQQQNEKMMTSIKNLLQMIKIKDNNTDYKSTIDAIQTWTTYNIWADEKNIVIKTNNNWKEWTITLNVVDNKIKTEWKTNETPKGANTTSQTENKVVNKPVNKPKEDDSKKN